MTAIRVVIADDHPLYRSGLRVLLDTQDDIEVVGEAATGDEAVVIVGHTCPDVAVLDLSMPGCGGLAAIGWIRAEKPGTRVLALTMLDDAETVRAAVRAGASGYLVKGASGDEAVQAIRAVARGEVVLAAEVAAEVLERLGGEAGPAAAGPFPELTERERDVLRLLAAGQANSSIARQLHLTEKTVRNYVTTVFRKLGVAGRVEAALRARDAGL